MLVKVKVTKSIAIPGDGKSRTIDLKPGIHEIDDNILSHWFVSSLVKKQIISIVGKKPAPVRQVPKPVMPVKVVDVIPDSEKEELRTVQRTIINSSVPEVAQKVAAVVINDQSMSTRRKRV